MAQFLLLTPFIDNAKEVAKWLGDASSDDISLSMDWQPNDRVLGIVSPEKAECIKGKSYNYRLNLEAVSTSRATLSVDELIPIDKDSKCTKTFNAISE
ncbi:hypothetical protein, partial [Pseudomonas viridiflava]|uniref:hypothetical protein n=1 Tax=Pseudomonas viridiflava TaxID=33069 RepID=UPI0019680939